MFQLSGVSVSFNPTETLLKNVSFAMRQGEMLVIVGRSGTGKSVLMKTMAGLIKPVAGTVSVFGKNLFEISNSERSAIMRKMGMLFQKNALFDSFTVFENLAFPLRETTNLSESEIRKKVDLFLKYVGLSDAGNLFPDEISGGMQKRVGIARALILSPEVILYDDPTAGLDPITSRLIVDLILRLKKEFNSTVVAITNDMNRAFQMADRVAIILDGTIQVTGDVEETKKHSDPRIQDFIHGRVRDVRDVS